jgi:TonB family protein
MKTKILLLFVLSAGLLYNGCSEKKNNAGFEVIRDYDSGYLTVAETETPPVFEGKSLLNESLLKNSMSDKKLFNKAGVGQTTYLYEININENGRVDKVRVIEGMGEELDDIAISQIKSWKYTPAKNNGKNVKSRMITFWNFSFFEDSEYTLTVYDDRKKAINPSVTNKIMSFNNKYFIAVEQMPEPIGGIKAIQEKIQYPELAKRAGVEGKVYVLAMINDKGDVDRVQIIRGLGTGLDEAAMDAVKQTKFKPGMQKGKPVNVQVSIPIIFRLN